jgi:hypothetical protein
MQHDRDERRENEDRGREKHSPAGDYQNQVAPTATTTAT